MPRRSEEWWVQRERDTLLFHVGLFMGRAAMQGDPTIARVAELLAKVPAAALAPRQTTGDER